MFTYGRLDIEDKIAELVQSEVRITDTEHVFLSAEVDFVGASYIGRGWARPKFIDTLQETKNAKINLLAVKSNEVEVAGIDVNGFEVATDRSTQALLNGAFAHSGRNPNTPFSFKGKNGWSTVNSAEIFEINNLVGEHVRTTFDKEKLLYDAIDAIANDGVTTDAEKLVLLEEFDINVEWDK